MIKHKLKKGPVFILVGILLILIFITYFAVDRIILEPKRPFLLEDLSKYTKKEMDEYATKNDLKFVYEYEYNDELEKDTFISQEIKANTKVKRKQKIKIILSNGPIPVEQYEKYGVNELGKVPVMMYHGIVDIPSNETKYTGGNVDKEGYNRTTEAFRADLEFYYTSGYRMIRLIDYVNGDIDVPLGLSPIVLTFDDGDENNFKVTGKDKNGNLEIDPNCAVGILEEYKKKYPDFNVTATFFLNSNYFGQSKYNKEIMEWLLKHGYDIGNHTLSHPDFTKIDYEKSVREVGGMYEKLEAMIPGKYVNIVALPFGSPYKTEHENFKAVMSGKYNGREYNTIATLRVGWQADSSPFSINFDKTFIKRIRAYDNNGKEFDIAMSFKIIEETRYISDGDKNTVVTPDYNEDYIVDTDKKVITY